MDVHGEGGDRVGLLKLLAVTKSVSLKNPSQYLFLSLREGQLVVSLVWRAHRSGFVR